MKESLIQRAIYNRNSDAKMIEFINMASTEEQNRPRGGCIAGNVQSDISMRDLVGHMALGGVFLYQILHEKRIKAEYDEDLLKYSVSSMRPSKNISIEYLMELLMRFDDALVKFSESIDITSVDVTDFEPYNPRRGAGALGYSAITWLEHTFSHQIHHRGQISQILSELGIGHDISQFRIYAFED